MSLCGFTLIFLFVGMQVLGLVTWRSMPSQSSVQKTAAPIIVKTPVSVAQGTFDPTALPSTRPRHL
jgi:hypothetical protein